MYTHISFDREDSLGVLTLNRPERLNAYNLAMVDELHDVFDQLDRDLTTRVLILTGAGRGFCAGIDLKEGVEGWPEPVGEVQAKYRLQQRLASMAVRLREIPQPVIAAVHGAAVGGGLGFALAADIRVADPTVRFGAAFIKIALSGGDDGASWMLPRIVGPGMAAEIIYTGRMVEAEEALRIGLVSRVTAEGAHVEAARDLARQILANSPMGIRMTKELLNFSLDAPALRHAVEMENRTQVLCMLTDDFAEGTAAFAEKRVAQYQDR